MSIGSRHSRGMKCAVSLRVLGYNTAAGTLGRGCCVFVGMIPRKLIGSSCSRHPDQSSLVDRAWELRTYSRSPIVPDHRGSAEEKQPRDDFNVPLNHPILPRRSLT